MHVKWVERPGSFAQLSHSDLRQGVIAMSSPCPLTQQNGRRSLTPLQFAPPVLRAKALGLMGSFKIGFMFITDCKWNKIPLPLRKGSGEVCKVCLLEMHPHVELAPSWQGPSPCPCAAALGRQTSSSSQHTRVPTRCGKPQDGAESAAPVAWHGYQRQVRARISHSRQLRDGAASLCRGKLMHGAGSHHGTGSSGRGQGQDFVFNLFLVYLNL